MKTIRGLSRREFDDKFGTNVKCKIYLYDLKWKDGFSFSIFTGTIDYKVVNCLGGEKYDEWVYNDDNTKCSYWGYYCEGGLKVTGSFIIKDKVYYDKIKDGFWIYYSEDGVATRMEEYSEGELINKVDFIDSPLD